MPDLTLANIEGKSLLLGVSYFDVDGQLLQQKQIAGTVKKTTEEDGITLLGLDGQTDFIIPSDLSPWFIAPPGEYHDPATGKKVTNPDFLVTWNVHKTKTDTPEGKHEWWEWKPQLQKPTVGD